MTDDEIRDAVRLMRWRASRANAPAHIWDLIEDADGLLKKYKRQVDRRPSIVKAIEKFLEGNK
jgi:hypothetical protein